MTTWVWSGGWLCTGKSLGAQVKSHSVSMKLVLAFGCLVILAFVLGTGDQRSAAAGPQQEPALPQAGRGAASYHGGLVTPPLPKPKFTLTHTSGTPFDFWSESQGCV